MLETSSSIGTYLVSHAINIIKSIIIRREKESIVLSIAVRKHTLKSTKVIVADVAMSYVL